MAGVIRSTLPALCGLLIATQRVRAFINAEQRTFAQNYQDTWAMDVWQAQPPQGFIAKLLNRKTPSPGFFLDIGAFDGFECSNSALMETSFGWKGVCVEPDPKNFNKRKCKLVQRAMSSANGEVLSLCGEGQVRKIGGACSRTVTSIDFPTLLREYQVPKIIDFMSLDVEGYEYKAFKLFPFKTYQIRLLVVELNGDKNKEAHLDHLLGLHSYVRRNVTNPGVDAYYTHSSVFWKPVLGDKPWRIHPPGSNGC